MWVLNNISLYNIYNIIIILIHTLNFNFGTVLNPLQGYKSSWFLGNILWSDKFLHFISICLLSASAPSALSRRSLEFISPASSISINLWSASRRSCRSLSNCVLSCSLSSSNSSCSTWRPVQINASVHDRHLLQV